MTREPTAYDANVNALKGSEFSLLHLAAFEGDAEMVRRLIAGGASPDVRGRDEYTPLHLTAFEGEVEAARALIDGGADPNAQNSDGNTPLHFAAINDFAELARALVAGGANPDARNRNRNTPIDYALQGSRETAKVLLDARSTIVVSPALLKLFNLIKRAFSSDARGPNRPG